MYSSPPQYSLKYSFTKLYVCLYPLLSSVKRIVAIVMGGGSFLLNSVNKHYFSVLEWLKGRIKFSYWKDSCFLYSLPVFLFPP